MSADSSATAAPEVIAGIPCGEVEAFAHECYDRPTTAKGVTGAAFVAAATWHWLKVRNPADAYDVKVERALDRLIRSQLGLALLAPADGNDLLLTRHLRMGEKNRRHVMWQDTTDGERAELAAIITWRAGAGATAGDAQKEIQRRHGQNKFTYGCLAKAIREGFNLEPGSDDEAFKARERELKARPADGSGGTGVPEFVITSAYDTDRQKFAPLKFVIRDVITEGLTLFCGKPKLGKSWMVLDWCLAVAAGGRALGSLTCEQGDVLLLALEDNRRRLQRRYRALLGAQPKPKRLGEVFESRRVDAGLVDQIRAWAKSVPNPRLVVIDTLKMIRPMKIERGSSAYENDYDVLEPLRRLAHELQIAIVVVHHVRKASADDVFDTVSGTLGLNGVADAIAVLARDKGGGVLAVRGRDIEEVEWSVAFAGGQWTKGGPADAARMTAERKRAFDVLVAAGKAMTAGEVAKKTGQTEEGCGRMLRRMVEDGDGVRKVGSSKFEAAQSTLDLGEHAPSVAPGDEVPF